MSGPALPRLCAAGALARVGASRGARRGRETEGEAGREGEGGEGARRVVGHGVLPGWRPDRLQTPAAEPGVLAQPQRSAMCSMMAVVEIAGVGGR